MAGDGGSRSTDTEHGVRTMVWPDAGMDARSARCVVRCLPGGAAAVPAAARGAGADLLEAIAAIDGLVATRLEGYPRLTATRRAGGDVHLALGALAHAGFAGRAALRAARRLVGQAFAGIEVLLARREYEVLPAITAPKGQIGGQTGTSLPAATRLNRDAALAASTRGSRLRYPKLGMYAVGRAEEVSSRLARTTCFPGRPPTSV